MPPAPKTRWPSRFSRPSAPVSIYKPAMAKRSAEPNDSDRIEGFDHPRETFDLVGQDDALRRAARALRAGRPPSAWLITGAPGVGKATLAYRIARYLLAYGATDA